jgi:hypothetical protein
MFWNLFHIWKKQIKSFFTMKLYDNIEYWVLWKFLDKLLLGKLI